MPQNNSCFSSWPPIGSSFFGNSRLVSAENPKHSMVKGKGLASSLAPAQPSNLFTEPVAVRNMMITYQPTPDLFWNDEDTFMGHQMNINHFWFLAVVDISTNLQWSSLLIPLIAQTAYFDPIVRVELRPHADMVKSRPVRDVSSKLIVFGRTFRSNRPNKRNKRSADWIETLWTRRCSFNSIDRNYLRWTCSLTNVLGYSNLDKNLLWF